MTYLYNDPSAFQGEMIEGFALAASRWVRPVPGGVMRVAGRAEGVAVVIGGGSGHYPAFGGLVGRGLAHAAAMGNLFASPSTNQVHNVAASVAGPGGVLFSYGHYAGDVANFDAAQERLRAAGVPCETVTVTDDVSSAPPAEAHRRRGIAGGLVVYKLAGASADLGWDLARVAGIARRANERTRTLGVAFSGCTLPGAGGPLFTVPAGRMAVGMGVHGEPGIDETGVPTADGLADLLLDRLLAEVPPGVDASPGARVAVILNGLGSVKYEELFVVYRRVARRLADAGLVVVDPEVGEFITSFEMAGASLTLTWLDEELERLWRAPADSPAFRKGSLPASSGVAAAAVEPETVEQEVPPATEDSIAAVGHLAAVMRDVASAVRESAGELGRLDAVVGDGDHGIGMVRGVEAAVRALDAARARGAGLRTALTWAADAWADAAGGTSGALWGAGLRGVAGALADDRPVTAQALAEGVDAALRAVRAAGHAELGDRTLVDVLHPFAAELRRQVAAGRTAAEAWDAAVEVADEAADATAGLLPRRGRAVTHGARAIGTPDAGAVSLALVLGAIAPVLRAQGTRSREVGS
jgi:dihydroxyacetone kinase